jgi:hypothetical protein
MNHKENEKWESRGYDGGESIIILLSISNFSKESDFPAMTWIPYSLMCTANSVGSE